MTDLTGSGIAWGDDMIVAERFTDRVVTGLVVTAEGWEAESDVTENWTRGRVCAYWDEVRRYERRRWMLRVPVLRRYVGWPPNVPASLVVRGAILREPVRHFGANVMVLDAVLVGGPVAGFLVKGRVDD